MTFHLKHCYYQMLAIEKHWKYLSFLSNKNMSVLIFFINHTEYLLLSLVSSCRVSTGLFYLLEELWDRRHSWDWHDSRSRLSGRWSEPRSCYLQFIRESCQTCLLHTIITSDNLSNKLRFENFSPGFLEYHGMFCIKTKYLKFLPQRTVLELRYEIFVSLR